MRRRIVSLSFKGDQHIQRITMAHLHEGNRRHSSHRLHNTLYIGLIVLTISTLGNGKPFELKDSTWNNLFKAGNSSFPFSNFSLDFFFNEKHLSEFMEIFRIVGNVDRFFNPSAFFCKRFFLLETSLRPKYDFPAEKTFSSMNFFQLKPQDKVFIWKFFWNCFSQSIFPFTTYNIGRFSASLLWNFL